MRRLIVPLFLVTACAEDPGLGETRPSFQLLGPAPHDFGGTYLGVEKGVSIRVRNAGRSPMHLCSLLQPAGAPFTAQGGCVDIPGASDFAVEVRYAPRAPGRTTTALVINHDAPEPSAIVAISGEGLVVPECHDGDPCTNDTFDLAAGVCRFEPRENGTACDDARACTTLDVCVDGRCVGGALDCGDGNACTRDLCEEPTGCVHLDASSRCGDSNPCTNDWCDPSGGCQHGSVQDGLPCSDGISCTYADVCLAGACTGVDVPDGTPCSDADPCTSDEQCQGGECFSAAASKLVAGDVRWSFDSAATTDMPFPRGLRAPGALDALGNLHVDDDPGRLVSLDACGAVRWEQRVTTRNLHLNYRRMVTADQLISVESESADRGYVDVVRARLLQTGVPLWTAPIEETHTDWQTDAVRINDAALTPWGGVVVAGYQDLSREVFEVDIGHIERAREHFAIQLDPAGRRRWRTLADAPQDESMFGYPLVVGPEGQTFAGTWAGFDPGRRSRLFAFKQSGALDYAIDWPDLNDYLAGGAGLLFEGTRVRARDFAGRLLWERPELVSDRYRLNYGAVSRPDGAFVVTRTYFGDQNAALTELVAVSRDGALLWRVPLAEQPTASLAVDHQGNVYTATGSKVQAFDTQGRLLWSALIPGGDRVRNILTIGPPGHLYTSSSTRMYALWIGPGHLAPSWARFRGGNHNGCTIPQPVEGL